MNLKIKIKLLFIIILSSWFAACNNGNQPSASGGTTLNFQNKGHELVYLMVQKVGDFSKFLDKENVRYTYTYQTPDGKADISTEKYIFNGELSYGNYKQHERTFPQLQGTIEQGYDGNEYWLKHKGKVLTDEKLLKRVAFNRPTNFYWFTMMPKLLDPGLNYEYLGQETINNQNFDVVKITFTSQGDKPTDIYQLYINQKTSLVDQFLFTVADFGKMETPNLMKLEYEEIEGITIPTKRRYKQSTWDADVSDKPWIQVTWSNIEFDVNLKKENFRKE